MLTYVSLLWRVCLYFVTHFTLVHALVERLRGLIPLETHHMSGVFVFPLFDFVMLILFPFDTRVRVISPLSMLVRSLFHVKLLCLCIIHNLNILNYIRLSQQVFVSQVVTGRKLS